LQTKAENEICKAQKLISEKDAELHAAEESLSGLVEVILSFLHGREAINLMLISFFHGFCLGGYSAPPHPLFYPGIGILIAIVTFLI